MHPLVLTIIVGLFVVIGILAGLKMRKDRRLFDFSIGASFGVIIMLIVFELISEAYEYINMEQAWLRYLFIAIVAAIGFLIFNILDKIVPHCHGEVKKKKKVECHCSNLGILACVALICHNFMEGMILYITAEEAINAGYLLCLGIGLHNIPMGMMIAGSFHNKKQLIIVGALLFISAFIGGLAMLAGFTFPNPLSIGIVFSLTIGMLIFIAFVELFNQMRHSRNKKICLLGAVIGIGIVATSLLIG